MSAPGIEHGRVSALMRGSMEHTACYAQEMHYPQCVLHGAYERQAAHGNDTGRPGGPEWLECPGPLLWRRGAFRSSFRDGIVGGGGRGIGRKEAGFLHLVIEIEVHLRRFENLFL